MPNKLTPTKAQQLTIDLVDICNTEGRDNRMLLEYIIDDYLYLIDDNQVNKLEDIIVNEFGYDWWQIINNGHQVTILK